MSLDLGTYNGIRGEYYNKILNATLPGSDDAAALDRILDDTGLTAEAIRLKLSTWKKTIRNGEEWYYDPERDTNWIAAVDLFGEDLGIEGSVELVTLMKSTQSTGG